MSFWIRETFVNETKGYQFGDSDWHEHDADTLGELYRALRTEYGGHVSKQYSDRLDKPPVQSGWVFRSRQKYDDSNKTYTREVWVSVSSTAPQKRVVNITRPWESAA